jgi:hypothetical protein
MSLPARGRKLTAGIQPALAEAYAALECDV